MDGRMAGTKLVCKLQELENGFARLDHEKAAAMEQLRDAQQVPALDLYLQDHSS